MYNVCYFIFFGNRKRILGSFGLFRAGTLECCICKNLSLERAFALFSISGLNEGPQEVKILRWLGN